MKALSIKEDFRGNITLEDFEIFKKKYSIIFPENLQSFLLDYNGAVTYKDIYFAKVENLFFPIQRILFLTTNSKNIASIGKIYEGHLSAGFKEFIPFAIDPGGWDYNFSLDEQSFGQIWINSFDDNEENPFSFVASSLEEFVDGLITENEAIKLGY